MEGWGEQNKPLNRVVMGRSLEETPSLCHMIHHKWTKGDKEKWKVTLGRLFRRRWGNSPLIQQDNLELAHILLPSPFPQMEWDGALWCHSESPQGYH